MLAWEAEVEETSDSCVMNGWQCVIMLMGFCLCAAALNPEGDKST